MLNAAAAFFSTLHVLRQSSDSVSRLGTKVDRSFIARWCLRQGSQCHWVVVTATKSAKLHSLSYTAGCFLQRERNERVKELGRRIQEANQERQAAAKPPAPKAKPASTRDRATAYAKSSIPKPEPTKSKVSMG